MKNFARLRSSAARRGFALLAAIGVLAVLMILAVAAVGSAQFTLGFSQARTADQRLGQALEEGATILRPRLPDLVKKAAASWSAEQTSTTVELIKPRPGVKDDVVVSATLGLVTGEGLPAGVQPRDGDFMVRLEAGRLDRPLRRSAIYLVNSAGLRRAPILIQEGRQ